MWLKSPTAVGVVCSVSCCQYEADMTFCSTEAKPRDSSHETSAKTDLTVPSWVVDTETISATKRRAEGLQRQEPEGGGPAQLLVVEQPER